MRGAIWASLLVFLALPCRAEDPAIEARELFAHGLAQARNGQWKSALLAFENAYRLSPRLSALFNLAGAQLRTGKLLHANANYHRIVDSKATELGPAHRRAAERQIKLIDERIPRLRIAIEGMKPDDRVLLDRTRLYPNELEMELWVDPGEHVVAIYRPNGRQDIRRILLIEGQHQYMSMRAP